MPNILILTVGTGTAGRYSNLTAGLHRTIELLSPRQFWLIPSTDQDSLAIADLLADGKSEYAGRFPLEAPDDLERCRQQIGQAIRNVRDTLQAGERLFVNPTSGTKQMTSAATLAALDEEIGDIVFTTGERADGVVKTGTECITSFDPADFFRERDLARAREFFDAGDFFAAERLLRPHNITLSREWANAHTCHHWRRLDYNCAKAYAPHLENRNPDSIIADIFAWSRHALQRGDADASMRLTYKGLERFARLVFEEKSGIHPNKQGHYNAKAIHDLRTPFTPDPNRKTVPLGLQALVRILTNLNHPFGRGFDWRLSKLANIRNETTHDIRPVDAREAQAFWDRATALIGHCRADFEPTSLPEHL